MPLTDEEKQVIRDEETFRRAVRKELAAAGGPPSFLARVSAFFESKTGFWLLTTALAGIAATGLTNLQRYIDREEISRRDKAERSLRDTETVLKLAPMLMSEKLNEFNLAVVLLDGLTNDNAVDSRVATQVKALFNNTIQAGNQKNATPEEQARRDALLIYADRTRITEIQQPNSASAAPVPAAVATSALDNAALPVRVYIQIGAATDRPMAERARETLRAGGLITPGIELVAAGRTPKQDVVRYCEAKTTGDALERVRAAVARFDPKPVLTPLNPSLCGNVRSNHFELWFAGRSAG
jgi:hypothetical protein